MSKSEPKTNVENENTTTKLEEITDREKLIETSWDEEWHPDFSI